MSFQEEDVENLEHEILELEKENDKLKRALRYAWLTLGFYKTTHNYTTFDNVAQDAGYQAQQAVDVVERLGFTPDEIYSWEGPFT